VVWQAVEEALWVVVLVLVEEVLTTGQLDGRLAACFFVIYVWAGRAAGQSTGWMQ
jgi:hypothetical protein